MPAFVFATREMNAAALPLMHDIGRIAVVRNPVPGDARPAHVVTAEQLARLRPRFAAAGIEIELLGGAAGEAVSRHQEQVAPAHRG